MTLKFIPSWEYDIYFLYKSKQISIERERTVPYAKYILGFINQVVRLFCNKYQCYFNAELHKEFDILEFINQSEEELVPFLAVSNQYYPPHLEKILFLVFLDSDSDFTGNKGWFQPTPSKEDRAHVKTTSSTVIRTRSGKIVVYPYFLGELVWGCAILHYHLHYHQRYFGSKDSKWQKELVKYLNKVVSYYGLDDE